MANKLSLLNILLLSLLIISSCRKDEMTPTQTTVCDFNSLTVSANETYEFNTTFSDEFSQSSRWESENADITLVDEEGQLTANSANTSNALEAWKLMKCKCPTVNLGK